MPEGIKSYLNQDFPVTSFVYAIYCDVEYSKYVVKKYIQNPEDWSPLEIYTASTKRPFPEPAEVLLYEEVPSRMKGYAPGTYNPPGGPAAKLFLKFVMPELTYQAGASEAAPQPPPNLAQFTAELTAERPLLSCLGQIFLNNNTPFDPLTAPGIDDEVKAALSRVRRTANGRPYLDPNDALALLPAFIDDVTAPPARW